MKNLQVIIKHYIPFLRDNADMYQVSVKDIELMFSILPSIEGNNKIVFIWINFY